MGLGLVDLVSHQYSYKEIIGHNYIQIDSNNESASFITPIENMNGFIIKLDPW